jgi:nitrogen fixation/metabolism regulation signal transduction histidine kinase
VTDVYPIHRNDINIYDLQGNLITSSEMEIFNKGIVGHRMESVVFLIFNKLNQEEVIVQERIGDLNYKSAYVPLRLPNEEKLGYLELPYYAKSRNLRDDVTDFMGTLLNVYVFLLLIASLIAIIVANSITKPISVIGERFRRFKLGSNEPLHWEGKDELGALITDYNRMIQQVEESTDKLKKSEREGAWRVMAQQVAHEIKNPLTPMKLSIQYLQYALKSNPDNVIPLIDKVARTLAEQIDNLSQIATAFSDFAKMPKTENKPLDLKSLLESVHTLFLENEQVEINAQLPKSPLYVFADKNHLLRVFNNLISNAIQAIPDDRPGKIDLYLYREGDKAIVKVSDNGKGIADEMKDKVFIPHFTTRSSGMGLGLAMCKDIVEMAEGKIYFHTVVGTGTDFFVELPVIESDEVS